jgi:hypothetical protein
LAVIPNGFRLVTYFFFFAPRRVTFFLETVGRARFAFEAVLRKAVAVVGFLRLSVFEAVFRILLASVLLLRTNSLPSRSAACDRLLGDKASDTALALAAIVPRVLPIDSATLDSRFSSFSCSDDILNSYSGLSLFVALDSNYFKLQTYRSWNLDSSFLHFVPSMRAGENFEEETIALTQR